MRNLLVAEKLTAALKGSVLDPAPELPPPEPSRYAHELPRWMRPPKTFPPPQRPIESLVVPSPTCQGSQELKSNLIQPPVASDIPKLGLQQRYHTLKGGFVDIMEGMNRAAKDRKTILACELEQGRGHQAKLTTELDAFMAIHSRKQQECEIAHKSRIDELETIEEFLSTCELMREQADRMTPILKLHQKQIKPRKTVPSVQSEKPAGIMLISPTSLRIIPDPRAATLTPATLRPAAPRAATLTPATPKKLGSRHLQEFLSTVEQDTWTTRDLKPLLVPTYGEEEVAARLLFTIGTLVAKGSVERVARGVYRLLDTSSPSVRLSPRDRLSAG